jgi:hypothetical protein
VPRTRQVHRNQRGSRLRTSPASATLQARGSTSPGAIDLDGRPPHSVRRFLPPQVPVLVGRLLQAILDAYGVWCPRQSPVRSPTPSSITGVRTWRKKGRGIRCRLGMVCPVHPRSLARTQVIVATNGVPGRKSKAGYVVLAFTATIALIALAALDQAQSQVAPTAKSTKPRHVRRLRSKRVLDMSQAGGSR